ncbi:hypothetical protein ANABIO32_18390 [Rossellomorea marisflavi]|nr:hypothetical protein ANABIO32_18390 [Rossellomorea marisflavi]
MLPVPQWQEYYELQWDVVGLKHTLFDLLTSPSLLFHVPFYDKHSDRIIQKQLDVEEDAVVLVEGVFLQRPEWIEYFDAVIFVDCPFHTRKGRVTSRDGYLGDEAEILKEYETRYWPAEDYYLDTIRPKEQATICYRQNEWREYPCDNLKSEWSVLEELPRRRIYPFYQEKPDGNWQGYIHRIKGSETASATSIDSEHSII